MNMPSSLRKALPVLAGLSAWLAFPSPSPVQAAVAWAHFRIEPGKPNLLAFSPTRTRFIRIAIEESETGQPCIDELEVYGPDDTRNLALASLGARATASSCLPG